MKSFTPQSHKIWLNIALIAFMGLTACDITKKNNESTVAPAKQAAKDLIEATKPDKSEVAPAKRISETPADTGSGGAVTSTVSAPAEEFTRNSLNIKELTLLHEYLPEAKSLSFTVHYSSEEELTAQNIEATLQAGENSYTLWDEKKKKIRKGNGKRELVTLKLPDEDPLSDLTREVNIKKALREGNATIKLSYHIKDSEEVIETKNITLQKTTSQLEKLKELLNVGKKLTEEIREGTLCRRRDEVEDDNITLLGQLVSFLRDKEPNKDAFVYAYYELKWNLLEHCWPEQFSLEVMDTKKGKQEVVNLLLKVTRELREMRPNEGAIAAVLRINKNYENVTEDLLSQNEHLQELGLRFEQIIYSY